MPRTNIFSNKNRRGSLKVRGALLIGQILLPFGLYFALRWELSLAAALISAVFFLSMIFLVWLG